MASPNTDGTPPASDPTSLPVPSVAVLLCGGCQHAIAREDDILHEKDPKAWRAHVYSYEIDLFESGKPVWAYSATNPSARRFDLLRIRLSSSPSLPVSQDEGGVAPSQPAVAATAASPPPCVSDPAAVAAPLFQLSGPYSAEHSFFEGFEWCFAHCAGCGHFLGWGFASSDRCQAAAEADGAGHAPLSSHTPSSTNVTRNAGDAEEDGVVTHSADSSRSSSEEGNEDAPVPVHPVPDFLGVIVTQCTGECEYPLAQYREDLRLAAHRRAVRAAADAFRTKLVRDLNALPFTDVAQSLYLYYRRLEYVLFTTGTVDVPPLGAMGAVGGLRVPLMHRRRRPREEDVRLDGGGEPDHRVNAAHSAPEQGDGLLPQAFHDLALVVQSMGSDDQENQGVESRDTSATDEQDHQHPDTEGEEEATGDDTA